MLAVASALLLVLPGGPAASAREDPASRAEITLMDVLSFDARDAGAACGNVDYPVPRRIGEGGLAPPNRDGVTRVDLFLFVLAIDEINSTTSSFRFEGYGGAVWCDPRHAFDEQAAGIDVKVFGEEEARGRLLSMWWPGLIFPSQLGSPQQSNELLKIYSDGTVRYSLKFNTRMMAQFDFTRFPLDRQTLRISVQTAVWKADRVIANEAVGQIGLDRRFQIAEWNVLGYASRTRQVGDFTEFVMELEIGRLVGFYVWKILLPLFIIVCVAWSTFWMTRDVVAQRQRQSATAILTVVAFQFIASGDLPRVAYLTLMDAVILWTYVCVGATLATNIVNKRRHREDEELGLRADRRGRVLFPIVYLSGVSLIFGLHWLL